MTKENIRRLVALALNMVQTGTGSSTVRLNDHWKFEFKNHLTSCQLSLQFGWRAKDGRWNKKTRQTFVDTQDVTWDFVTRWLMQNSNKLLQWKENE